MSGSVGSHASERIRHVSKDERAAPKGSHAMSGIGVNFQKYHDDDVILGKELLMLFHGCLCQVTLGPQSLPCDSSHI